MIIVKTNAVKPVNNAIPSYDPEQMRSSMRAYGETYITNNSIQAPDAFYVLGMVFCTGLYTHR